MARDSLRRISRKILFWKNNMSVNHTFRFWTSRTIRNSSRILAIIFCANETNFFERISTNFKRISGESSIKDQRFDEELISSKISSQVETR